MLEYLLENMLDKNSHEFCGLCHINFASTYL